MKFYLSSLFLVFGTSVGLAQESVVTETFKTDTLTVVCQFDTVQHSRNGSYFAFYPNGNFESHGYYKAVDSAECESCYDVDYFDPDTVSRQYFYERMAWELRVGLWSFYYPNGELRMRGKYSSKVHAYSGHPDLTMNMGKVVCGWVHIDYLKDGCWEYFNESGCLSKSETYKDGNLIFVIDYVLVKDE